MKVNCIGSSSMGNCYIMQFSNENGYKETIMLEAGYSWNDILKKSVANKIANDLYDVKACLITHGHSDHAKGIKQLTFNGIDVYATQNCHEQHGTLVRGKIIKSDETTCIAPGINVYAFKVEHDYENSLGFIISCKPTGETILFVNDCKFYTQDLSAFKFDYIFMECNYEEKYTYTIYNQAKKENDLAKVGQYKRVIDSHMGLQTTIKNLKKLNLEKTKCIFLMHLSERNANEFKMKNEVRKATNKLTLVCQRNGGIK